MDREKLPFSEVLDRLFSEKNVPVSLLYRLSDMSPGEMSDFEARWATQPVERRRVLVRHLVDISENNFVVDFGPVFLKLLADDAAEVRVAAVEGLWDSSHIGAVGPIIRVMENDQDVGAKAAAATCLGHFILMAEWGQIKQAIGDRIVNALAQQYEADDTAENVRRAILESLGNSADPRVRGYIDEAYRHGGDMMQMSAVFAMGRSADSRWAPILIQEMTNPDAEMRMEAARAAGEIGSSDAVEQLIELLEDDELQVQLAAVEALGQIGSDQAYEALSALLDRDEAEELTDAIEEAMEEIEWGGNDLDLSFFDWRDDDDDLE